MLPEHCANLYVRVVMRGGISLSSDFRAAPSFGWAAGILFYDKRLEERQKNADSTTVHFFALSLSVSSHFYCSLNKERPRDRETEN